MKEILHKYRHKVQGQIALSYWFVFSSFVELLFTFINFWKSYLENFRARVGGKKTKKTLLPPFKENVSC